MIQLDKDHEVVRKQLWSEVYVAYVSAANATNPNGAARWADIALEEFDKRFRAASRPLPAPR